MVHLDACVTVDAEPSGSSKEDGQQGKDRHHQVYQDRVSGEETELKPWAHWEGCDVYFLYFWKWEICIYIFHEVSLLIKSKFPFI